MAIYHLTVSLISRARGQSVTAAAAYRAGSRLRDERYGLTHDYTRQRTALHTDIMLPAHAPAWARDRASLWNRVEANERRKDAQLARAIDIGLPVELSDGQNFALLREYVGREFVSLGMIADFSIHRRENGHLHAHILLTLRAAAGTGFGPKARHWNRKSHLLDWRAAWAELANRHLAAAGHEVRIDHRTLEEQQIELTPSRKLGVRSGTAGARPLPDYLSEREAEQRQIARDNGELIIEDATVALRALTRQRATFTRAQLLQFLTSRTVDAVQREAALAAVLRSSELAALPAANGQPERFTSQDLLEAHKSLMKRVAAMSRRRGHPLASAPATGDGSRDPFLDYLLGDGDIKALAASAVAGAELLAAARVRWESIGRQVLGVAPSKVGVQRLQASTGIASRTLASWEQEWREERELLAPDQVLVVDGAEMIGLKQLERLVASADKARATIVLLGDALQLRAMNGTSPLQGILDAAGLIMPDVLPHR